MNSYTKLNLVIPMAGLGSRFADAGYSDPKPFISFLGKMMIEHVIDALPIQPHYIFIVLKEHIEKYNADTLLKNKWPDCDIIILDEVTQGAACTVLKAEHLIDNDDTFAIMNSDNIIHWSKDHLVKLNTVDGLILTFEDIDPKWSFASLDKDGYVLEVVEKKAISTHATAGLYFWKKGSSFVSAAKSMILKNIRVNNEFYVAPVYNQNIEAGERIVIGNVIEMNGVGIPEDLETYIKKQEEKLCKK